MVRRSRDRAALRVLLAEADSPVELISAALFGEDGWVLEVVDGEEHQFVHIKNADLDAAQIAGSGIDDHRKLTVADLAELPDIEDFRPTSSTRADESVDVAEHSAMSAAAGSDPDRVRWSIGKLAVALSVCLLLVGGGFAAGWLVNDASTASDAPASSTAVPLADLFDASPGALDGRVVPGRPGATWADPSGSLVVADGAVRVVPQADLPVIAILEQSGTITSVRAAFSTVSTTAGLVFRYQDADNYWQVTAVPKFATWAISRIEQGEATAIGDVGFTSGSTIDVIFVGSSIQFLVDGVLGEIIRDDFLAEAELIGLIVGSTGDDVVVDEFYANTI
ncbi:MAG: hypothetical protein ACI83Y_002176 [Candidatus Azotimanducaceae bacterium]|jgi:hypothetical protein